MGVVWRAHDRLLDREVAVKEVVISALISAEERRNAYQRTLREARTAARLSHRGVVAIYDVVEEDGRPWIIMELVPSQSLDQLLVVEGRLSAARACRIGLQLLSALAAAHLAGVMHRDVKPSNVLIATNRIGEGWDERAVLTDFGIAQFEGDPRLTQTGMVMGSPGFTAPERIRGSDATPASDLWSLGATLYAAVEGHGPYENRGGAITTMSAIINEDAPLAPHGGPLAPIIAALLRRDPRGRPSASLAARMFAQAQPRLTEADEEARRPTTRSSYVPAPAAPVAPASVRASDGGRPGKDQAPAAREEPAREERAQEAPPALVPAAEEAPAGEEAAERGVARQGAAKESPEAVAARGAGKADAEAAEPSPAPAQGPAAAAAAGDKAAAEAEPEAEAGPAAETTRLKVPILGPALLPVPGTPPAEVPAAESKAAALLAPEADDGKPGSRAPDTVVTRKGAETVVPRRGSAGRQPTEGPVPGARRAPAVPSAAPPAEQDRPKPSFSAVGRPRPATLGRPTPPRTDARGVPALPPIKEKTAPLAYEGGKYGTQGRPGARYGGPSRAAPDLSRRPGRRGQRRQLMWAVLAVLVAAAIGVGTALVLSHSAQGTAGAGGTGTGPTTIPSVKDTMTGFKSVNALNDPSSKLPGPDWSVETVTQADAQSAVAGFSIDVPTSDWTMAQEGLRTDFTGPDGMLVEVDLTQQTTPDMLTAATQVKNGSLSPTENQFPGYAQQNLQAEPVRSTEGAVWSFTWTPSGGGKNAVNDIFFAQAVSGGVQDYAIFIESPSSTFGTSLTTFDEMLRTFRVVP